MRQKQDGNGVNGFSSSGAEHRWRPRSGRKQKAKAEKGDRDGGKQGRQAVGAGGDCKPARDNVCLNYRRQGHWEKDYPEPRRERGRAAHVTQVDDSNMALFLAHGFLELDDEPM